VLDWFLRLIFEIIAAEFAENSITRAYRNLAVIFNFFLNMRHFLTYMETNIIFIHITFKGINFNKYYS
jgi:hypothetical protein